MACKPVHCKLAIHSADLRKSCSPADYPMHYKPQPSASYFISVTK